MKKPLTPLTSAISLGVLAALWLGAAITVFLILPQGTRPWLMVLSACLTTLVVALLVYKYRLWHDTVRQRLTEAEQLGKVGYWRWNLKDKLHLSPEARAIYQLPAAQTEFNFGQYLKGIHPEDQSTVSLGMSDLADGHALTMEHRLRLPGMEERLVLIKGEPVHRGSRVISAQGWVQDITEQHNAERRVKQSEQWFAQVFREAAIPTLVSSVDDGVILDLNKAFLQVSGFTREEVVGRTSLELGLWADPDERARINARVIEEGVLHDVPLRMRDRHGEIRHILYHVGLTVRGNRRVLLSQFQDVTEHYHAQRLLEQSQERFEIMFRQSPLPTALASRKTLQILDINEAFRLVTGYSHDEAVGRTGVELGLWNSKEERSATVSTEEHSGSLRGHPACFTTRAGNRRDCILFTERLELNDEPCLFLQFGDITEEKQARERANESAERFTRAFEANPIPNLITSLETGQILAANAAFCETFGYKSDELLEQSILDIGLWPNPEERQEMVDLIRAEGRIARYPRRVHTRDGALRDVLVSSESISLEGKTYTLSLYEDVTESNRLKQETQLSATALANAGEAVSIHDAEGRIVLINDAFTRDTGYTIEDLRNQNAADFIYSANDTNPDLDRNAIATALENQGHWEGESWFRRKNGEVYPRLLNVGVVKNEDGKITHYISVSNDISRQKAIEEQLEHLAHHDALTGLPNRALFADRCDQALLNAKRHDHGVALLYLDLDKFKQINDTHGHLAGDAVLNEIAERMKGCVRASDTVCRLGGDEFVVLIREIAEPADAEEVAKKLIAAVQPAIQFEDKALTVSTSIGIAWFPAHGDNTDTLIGRADDALYEAKKAGRNNYQISPNSSRASSSRLS